MVKRGDTRRNDGKGGIREQKGGLPIIKGGLGTLDETMLSTKALGNYEGDLSWNYAKWRWRGDTHKKDLGLWMNLWRGMSKIKSKMWGT